MKNKTYEQRRYKRKLTLGEYLKKRIENTELLFIGYHYSVPASDVTKLLLFYISMVIYKNSHKLDAPASKITVLRINCIAVIAHFAIFRKL